VADATTRASRRLDNDKFADMIASFDGTATLRTGVVAFRNMFSAMHIAPGSSDLSVSPWLFGIALRDLERLADGSGSQHLCR
jgi:hypothetical protein